MSISWTAIASEPAHQGACNDTHLEHKAGRVQCKHQSAAGTAALAVCTLLRCNLWLEERRRNQVFQVFWDKKRVTLRVWHLESQIRTVGTFQMDSFDAFYGATGQLEATTGKQLCVPSTHRTSSKVCTHGKPCSMS